MPTAFSDLPAQVDPPRKLWTRSEYEELYSSVLKDRLRLELIEGELINKTGKNRPHVNALSLLYGWLIEVFGIRRVNPEAPIDVTPEDNPSNEPEPDLIVLKRDLSYFKEGNVQPEDLDLVVEISDSTLGFDLITKAALYARARIVECWVLDVNRR